MKENLERYELGGPGVAAQWPVLLGCAALTMRTSNNYLTELYLCEGHYWRPGHAFECMRRMGRP